MLGRHRSARTFQDTNFGDDVPLGAEAAVGYFAGPRPQDWFRGLRRDLRGDNSLDLEDPEVANARVLDERRKVVEAGQHRFGENSRRAEAVRLAHKNGVAHGWRQGYISGMHWGLAAGAIAGALLVCLLVLGRRFVWPMLLAWFA